MARVAAMALLLGGMLAVLNVILFGAGHGIYGPALICFGPIHVIGQYAGNYLFPIIGAPFLYAGYAIVLTTFRSRGRALTGLLAVLLFHHAFVAAGWSSSEMRRLANYLDGAGARDPFLWMCGGVYLLTNALAIVYAVKGKPKTVESPPSD